MLLFKKFDWIFQAMLIVIFIAFNVITKKEVLSTSFFAMYFTVGGWQLISAIIHFFLPAESRLPNRKSYVILVALTLVVSTIMVLVEPDGLIQYLIFILFWTAGLAFIYLYLCIKETRRLQQNPPITQ